MQFIWPVYSTSSFIVNKFDCVPEHEHGNAKTYPRTKESMKNLLKAKLECKGCIGYCIPSRGGVIIILHLEDANSTALLQTKATPNKS